MRGSIESPIAGRPGQIPAGKIAVGVPARVIGDVKREQREFWDHGKDLYIDLAARYPKGLRRFDPGDPVD